ncbi:sensor domain-containing diguanylate cyclase [Cryptosporangium phraense]|uniref:GGDEF domain-containing protein n=1 Tax=Cryptosporangium phraense TaxID=2593070 RepID=A0A545B0B0_9ACTN|nr:GGDEF domain-containing protein [Cryptosporangium phraense]TQS47012.1 GGDEF domain-containing protein [Cryptosporangium phraense]
MRTARLRSPTEPRRPVAVADERATRLIVLAAPVVLVTYAGFAIVGHHLETFLATALQLGGVSLLTVAVVRGGAGRRIPWILLVAAHALVGVSSVNYAGRFVRGTYDPALSTLCSVLAALLVLGAVVAWSRRAGSLRDRAARDRFASIDVAIIVVVSAFLSWAFVVAPVLHRPDVIGPAKVIVLTFSIADLITIGLTVRILFATRATPALRLFLTYLLLWSSADGLVVADLTGNGAWMAEAGGPIRILALFALVGAAYHPSMTAVVAPGRTAVRVTSAGRLVLLGLATAVTPVVLLIQHFQRGPEHVPAAAVACLLVSALVMARMARLVAEQRGLAITDGLTGLHTRRFFDEALSSGTAQNLRTTDDIGLLLVDLDHFKSVNDTHGHPAGDQVLREVARRLRDSTRSGDVVARYGGEEFAILLPRTGRPELVSIAERIRAAIDRDPVRLPNGRPLRVTVSIGLAAASEGLASSDELTSAADRRLYAAKAGGRNQVSADFNIL